MVEHRNAVAQRHGFHLVVGDVNHGRAQLFVQPGQLHPHVHAQRSVQVGQRLVKQKHLGLAHNGAANGHALALAAREFFGVAPQQLAHAQGLSGLVHLLRALGFGHAGHLQGKAHVLFYGHVRVQGVALEHHGSAPVGRAQVVGAHAVNQQVARANALQARDHAQRGRFAAARGADKHQKLAVLRFNVNAANHLCFFVAFADAPQRNRAHGAVSFA